LVSSLLFPLCWWIQWLLGLRWDARRKLIWKKFKWVYHAS